MKKSSFPKIYVSLEKGLVKATVRERKNGNTVYRQLQYRDGSKVRSHYLGSTKLKK